MIGAAIGLLMQVQMAVVVRPETVTVGQHFAAIVRIRAPRGSTIQMPVGTSMPLFVDTAGPMRRIDTTTANYTQTTAAYILAAWDTGPRKLGLGDVLVETPTGERRIALGNASVVVASVLPRDPALRKPKQTRLLIPIVPFNWLPWIIAAIIAGMLALGWGVWWFFHRPRPAPMPLDWAESEFRRIEALHLLEKMEPEQHAILMVSVLRRYLTRRLGIVRDSATTRELALTLRREPMVPWERVLRLFERIDLLKFAQATIVSAAAETMGTDSRAIVRDIDAQLRAAAAALADAERHAAPERAA